MKWMVFQAVYFFSEIRDLDKKYFPKLLAAFKRKNINLLTQNRRLLSETKAYLFPSQFPKLPE